MAEKMVQFDNYRDMFMDQLNCKFNLKVKELERKLERKFKEGLDAQNKILEKRLEEIEKQQ